MTIDSIVDETLSRAKEQLLAQRGSGGYWPGELSSSALATATAVCALAAVDKVAHQNLIGSGLNWLAQHSNSDGGWGDTVCSPSNISTTALCWSAYGACDWHANFRDLVSRAESWLARHAGKLQPATLAQALKARYGKDRTFSVPILTMCAIAGRLGKGSQAWKWVDPLPFELASCPPSLWKWLKLPVVSYALPALIAIGQVRFHHLPPRNPVLRVFRHSTRRRTLKLLQKIQPGSGGFLEAIPLTSFVVMSLVHSCLYDDPVVRRGVQFLISSARQDGSWPIDTNLATWVTTGSLNALAVDPSFQRNFCSSEIQAIRDWLVHQQFREEHPYTCASPGGWGWTNLSGAVPDADDTAGALRALHHIGGGEQLVCNSVVSGIKWLLQIQNRDGGIPTFCKGWGTLPFDRSSADITAHAVCAFKLWIDEMPPDLQLKIRSSIKRALAYLLQVQTQDGSWTPLWFGNQFRPSEENATYGTSRVLLALNEFADRFPEVKSPLNKGINLLLSTQNADGGWGGAKDTPSSIEETALALDALAAFAGCSAFEPLQGPITRGVTWLYENTKTGLRPSPIGLYFAKLWYFEKLYPLIFTVSALERIKRLLHIEHHGGNPSPI